MVKKLSLSVVSLLLCFCLICNSSTFRRDTYAFAPVAVAAWVAVSLCATAAGIYFANNHDTAQYEQWCKDCADWLSDRGDDINDILSGQIFLDVAGKYIFSETGFKTLANLIVEWTQSDDYKAKYGDIFGTGIDIVDTAVISDIYGNLEQPVIDYYKQLYQLSFLDPQCKVTSSVSITDSDLYGFSSSSFASSSYKYIDVYSVYQPSGDIYYRNTNEGDLGKGCLYRIVVLHNGNGSDFCINRHILMSWYGSLKDKNADYYQVRAYYFNDYYSDYNLDYLQSMILPKSGVLSREVAFSEFTKTFSLYNTSAGAVVDDNTDVDAVDSPVELADDNAVTNPQYITNVINNYGTFVEGIEGTEGTDVTYVPVYYPAYEDTGNVIPGYLPGLTAPDVLTGTEGVTGVIPGTIEGVTDVPGSGTVDDSFIDGLVSAITSAIVGQFTLPEGYWDDWFDKFKFAWQSKGLSVDFSFLEREFSEIRIPDVYINWKGKEYLIFESQFIYDIADSVKGYIRALIYFLLLLHDRKRIIFIIRGAIPPDGDEISNGI